MRLKRKTAPKKPTAGEVIRRELKKAYEMYPAYPMPSAIEVALSDAGYAIVYDFDNEIALAYQAGAESEREA